MISPIRPGEHRSTLPPENPPRLRTCFGRCSRPEGREMGVRARPSLGKVLLVLGALGLAIWRDTRELPASTDAASAAAEESSEHSEVLASHVSAEPRRH